MRWAEGWHLAIVTEEPEGELTGEVLWAAVPGWCDQCHSPEGLVC
jgi:hypothetical protein